MIRRLLSLIMILGGLWVVFYAANIAMLLALWRHATFFMCFGVFIVFVGVVELCDKRAFWRGRW